jgi:hypothetical protein
MTNSLQVVTFTSTQKMLEFVKQFLNDRLSSLEYDVDRCIKIINVKYVPVPALLYCVSVINLLGGLNSGDTKIRPHIRREIIC